MSFVLGRRALIMALMLSPLSAGTPFAQSPEPVAIVRQIFETYSKDGIPRVPWSPPVAARLKKADITADPILEAQDTDVKGFVVKEVSRGADRALIEVNFNSFDRKMRSQFDFRVVDGKWMVANYRILAGVEFAPHDLRKTLKMSPLQ